MLGDLDGTARELDYAFAEALQVRVVGRARDRALVVAFHEHDRLPERERDVPVEVVHSTPRAGLVTGDHFRPAREPGLLSDALERELSGLIAGLDPGDHHVAAIP